MIDVATFAFRNPRVADLTDPTKGEVSTVQLQMVAHDESPDREGIKYEDNKRPSWEFVKGRSGDITISGHIETYIYPDYAAGALVTKPLFELNHFYLIRFIALDERGTGKMVYGRWIGQYIEKSQENRETDNLNKNEVKLAIVIFGTVNDVDNVPYNATASATPGPVDPTPTGDYDPTFMAIVPDTVKTVEAAEAEISATLTNPF